MPITREEKLLNTLATGVASGVSPITREEQYLSYIAGETYTKPDAPITRKEAFLDRIPQGGGGGSGVTIKNQNKTITENGTYTADSGYTGLGTVTVDVQASGGTIKFATGTLIPSEDTNIIKIEHGMGVEPDLVVYFAENGTNVAKTALFGINAVSGLIDVDDGGNKKPSTSAAQYNENTIGTYFWSAKNTSQNQKLFLNEKIDNAGVSGPYCAPHSADTTKFVIGTGSEYYVRAAISYRWIAIAGVEK